MDEKLISLVENERFMQKILEAETAEEASALFAKEGVNISVRELEIIRMRLEDQENGELAEEDLVSVSGGVDAGSINDCINAFVKVGEWLYDSVTACRW